MRPFRSFGLFTAIGVVSAMVYSLLVTPVAIAWWPWSTAGRARRPAVAGWLGAFGEAAYRRRRLLLVATGVVALLAAVGVSRVYVQDSWMGNFDPDSRVRRAFDVVRERLLGPMVLYIEMDTGEDDGIKEPQFLESLMRLEEGVKKLPSVGGTLSVAKILRKVHREFTGTDTVPQKKGASALFLMLMEGKSYDNLWRPPYRRCLVHSFCRTDDYVIGRRDFPVLQGMVDEHLPGVVVSYGGDFALSYHWVRLLISSFAKAFSGSAVLVFLAVLLFSRSLRFSVLTITPILLALLLNFGVMGLLGIPFGVATSMFSSIILGIGIDYAIHLQSKLDALGGAGAQAARLAFASAGKAILWDAVVVISGFSVLLLSEMPPTRILGIMVALGMGASFVATYLLLPALWRPQKARPVAPPVDA
jgi:predicted RND superfamily exporter protein